MKNWVLIPLIAFLLSACTSTDGVYAEGPVSNTAQFAGDYLASDKVDQQPVAIKQVPPDFPAKARKANLDGTAFVTFIVTTDGKPEQVQVTEATHPLFAEAAVEAVKQWEFKPGIKDGQPVRTAMTIPVQFLRSAPPPF